MEVVIILVAVLIIVWFVFNQINNKNKESKFDVSKVIVVTQDDELLDLESKPNDDIVNQTKETQNQTVEEVHNDTMVEAKKEETEEVNNETVAEPKKEETEEVNNDTENKTVAAESEKPSEIKKSKNPTKKNNKRKKSIQRTEKLSNGIVDKKPSEIKTENVFFAPDANVLVVDDEEESRKRFKLILTRIGAKYHIVEGGIKCLEMVKYNKYDMIFISHKMVRMDGIETLRNLNKLEGNKSKNAVLIALSWAKVSESIDVYKTAGFDGCMTKPVGIYSLQYNLMDKLPKELTTFTDELKEQVRIAMEGENSLISYGICMGDGIEKFDNDVQKYKEAVSEFCDEYDEVHSELVNLLYDGNNILYGEKISELGLRAVEIGLNELYDMTNEHIELAELEEMGVAEAAWRPMVLEWEKNIKGLRKWLGKSDTFKNVTEVLAVKTNGIELSDQELGIKLKEVVVFIKNGDITGATKKLNDLKEYELEDEVRVFMEITSHALRSSDGDKAAETIKKIIA